MQGFDQIISQLEDFFGAMIAFTNQYHSLVSYLIFDGSKRGDIYRYFLGMSMQEGKLFFRKNLSG
ncbi:MAG: hypothetical protein AAF391_06570 [Bacteroidota bacterium]